VKKKLISFLKVGIFLGLGIFLVWLSFLQLKPSMAKLQNGFFLMTPSEDWAPGSAIFLAKEDGSKLGSVADHDYVLADGRILKVSSGKLIEIAQAGEKKDELSLFPSDKTSIKKSLREANYWWLGLSVLIGILSHVTRAYRWGILLEPMGYKPKFLNSFFAVMVGYVVNYGVPRLGEVSRCTVIDRYEKIPFTKAFGTVVAERILDMIFFLIIFFVMLFTQYDKIGNYMNENIWPVLNEKWTKLINNTNLLLLIVGMFVLVAGVLFYFRKKIKGTMAEKVKNFVKGFGEGLRTVRKVKNPIWFIFLTSLIWICYYFMLHVCFQCFNSSAQLGFSEGITAFVFGTFTVMLTPGGIGAYPFALQKVMYKVYGVPEALGFAIGWLSWIAGFISIISLGLLSFIFLPIYNKTKNEQST
jgi:hypothetical protein